jgi:starch-binding outer membrane protein, SusD/RagB family
MKNFKLISILTVIMFLMSCNADWLEVKPSDRLSETNFYQNEDHAIRAITSCYDPLKHPRGFSLNYYFVFETFSDRALHEQINLNNMIINPSDGRYYDIWINLTQGIYRCNLAIEKIAGLKGNPGIEMNEELKSRLIGEAKFLRALYYYYFTKIYRNPPLITETIEDLDIQLTNASQEDLFAFMEQDLLDAINRLPATYDNANLGRATKGAAHTLLGKVYLYQHKFQQARDQFLAVKNLNVYELIMPLGNDSIDFTSAFQSNFTGDDIITPQGTYAAENNKESVFEIQFALGGWEIWEGGWQADGKLTTLFFGPEGYRNMVPTSDYVAQFEEAPENHPAGLQYDPRKYVTFYMPGDTIYYVQDKKPPIRWRDRIHTNASITQGYGWGKYFKPTFFDESSNLNNDYNNVRLLRYSDVLLLLAEAEYLVNGSTPVALDAINAVRARAGLNLLTEVTPQAIIHERDVEFGFEFKRYWDLVRWSKYPTPWVNITELLPAYIPAREGYMPIPVAEINLSRGALRQNPGY